MRLWVLLFNARTDNEGIYTLCVQGQNKVIAFEDEDDAIRYALQLEAQDFMSATVEAIDQAELDAFCKESDLELSLVTPGMLAVPPETTVENMGWTPEDKPPQLSELDRLRQRLEKLL